jgi:hypothetical protein
MPLAFDTTSHGRVAFGFFNIESDMLLLENYFFFADRFCEHLVHLAENHRGQPFQQQWVVYEIPNPKDMGDLMGAIQGITCDGFIGRLYDHFPFPTQPDDFKQNPSGFMTRLLVKKMISHYARKINILFSFGKDPGGVRIGPYAFNRHSFQELIHYVWLGGYPRWKEGIAPPYVIRMKKVVERSRHFIFKGMVF